MGGRVDRSECMDADFSGSALMDMTPLSRERREELEAMAADSEGGLSPTEARDLLSAEGYWREQVKNAKFRTDFEYDVHYALCSFCGNDPSPVGEGHAPDCAWVLAQS